jgi:hypothetical protein
LTAEVAEVLLTSDNPGPNVAGDPPCLRRRAPARIDLTLKSGRCVTIARRKVHLSAGQTVVLQVVPQTPAAKVEIAAEHPLQVIVPASRVEGNRVPMYHAEFSGRSPLRIIPIPRTGNLHVTVIDGLPAPCRITIPVTVSPAYSTLVLWWVLAFLSIVGVRWQRTVANSNSFTDIRSAMWGDLPYLLALLIIGFLVLIPIRLIGWLISLAEPGPSSE